MMRVEGRREEFDCYKHQFTPLHQILPYQSRLYPYQVPQDAKIL